MTTPVAGGTAHNPTIKTDPRELIELRQKVRAVVEFCLENMSGPTSQGGLTNADTIEPTAVLDFLGVDYGPGSDLASQSDEE